MDGATDSIEHGRERAARIGEALDAAGLDALIGALPENVLMLSGYWPVVGTAIAIARRGRVAVLAPEDERDLADGGWAEVRTYQPGSLTSLIRPGEAAHAPLGALLNDLGLTHGRLGFDDGEMYEGSSYAAMHLYQTALRQVLVAAAPGASLVSVAQPIAQLRSKLTVKEVGRVRLACEIAGQAFVEASRGIRSGLREPEIGTALRAYLEVNGLARESVRRAGGFAWCLSGPNSALAGAAYARTRNRELRGGDLVLVHCNSYVDGYWTDITRTYCLGEPEARQTAMYDAVFAARAAALSAIRPGARAADVDAAARNVLAERGFGQYFTHGVGHNVGFSAIGMEFPPRLHPASPDRLEVGMTFNIEPAIYIQGYGGIRHCDVVTLEEEGPNVLTAFQEHLEHLIITW